MPSGRGGHGRTAGRPPHGGLGVRRRCRRLLSRRRVRLRPGEAGRHRPLRRGRAVRGVDPRQRVGNLREVQRVTVLRVARAFSVGVYSQVSRGKRNAQAQRIDHPCENMRGYSGVVRRKDVPNYERERVRRTRAPDHRTASARPRGAMTTDLVSIPQRRRNGTVHRGYRRTRIDIFPACLRPLNHRGSGSRH